MSILAPVVARAGCSAEQAPLQTPPPPPCAKSSIDAGSIDAGSSSSRSLLGSRSLSAVQSQVTISHTAGLAVPVR